MIGRASPAQRASIERLMLRGECDMHRIDCGHEMMARNAGIPVPTKNQLVDDWIYGMQSADASKLIKHLQEIDHEE